MYRRSIRMHVADKQLLYRRWTVECRLTPENVSRQCCVFIAYIVCCAVLV
jgi:hypothetical protein